MKFFFNLSHFLVIIISVVRIHKVITKIIINVEIDIGKNNIININKNSSLIIIIISVNNNNIKQL